MPPDNEPCGSEQRSARGRLAPAAPREFAGNTRSRGAAAAATPPTPQKTRQPQNRKEPEPRPSLVLRPTPSVVVEDRTRHTTYTRDLGNGLTLGGSWAAKEARLLELEHETHHDVVIGYYNHFGTRRSRWSIRKHANNNDWYGSGDGDHTSHPADLRWHVVKELGTPGLKPPPTVRREIAGPPGKLQVQVVRGTGLAGKNLAVKLTLGKQVFVTRPVARGTDPIWNATHDFELYAEPELRLEVFDDETVTVAMGADDYIQPDRHKVVGHARVKIHWIAAGTFETDVYVLDKSKKMAGKVTLKATLSRPSGGGDAEPAREPVTGVVVEGEVAPEAPMMEAEPWGEVASGGEVQLGGEFELEGES